MKATSDTIVRELKERGYRVTQARTRVVAALLAQAHPQTIQELVGAVDVDEASVYRTIEILVQEGLVESIAASRERPRYSLAAEHHHHVVCESCGTVAHVPCEPVHTPRTLPPEFTEVHAHEVTFFGRCKKCV